MNETVGNKGSEEPMKGFRFHEQLEVASEDILKWYEPFEGIVYRTFIENPPEEKDFTAQDLREPDGNALVQGGVSDEEYKGLKTTKRQEYISKRAISVNDSRDNAIAAAVDRYNKLKEQFGTEYADLYIEEQRGKYVAGINFKEGQAMISKFRKGHANVILNQEVPWEDIEIIDITEYKYKDE